MVNDVMTVSSEKTPPKDIPCPYSCGAMIPPGKEALENHIAVCPKATPTGGTYTPRPPNE